MYLNDNAEAGWKEWALLSSVHKNIWHQISEGLTKA